MKLAQLFSIFPQLNWGDAATRDVVSLCFDSRQLEKGCVYVAIRGVKVDGHQFLGDAVAKGAIGLVVEDEKAVPTGYTGAVVKVGSTREALNRLAAHYFGEPARKMFCVGVTGTNGKTSTTHLVEAILNEFGWPTGVIGTINHHLKDHVWQTEMTTPDPLSFQRRLQEFLAMGAQAVALEASSHALKQSRVDEVDFDVAIFTNLTRDHLDYHPDMEDYFQAKARLFTPLLTRSRKPGKVAIVNKDDAYGRRIDVGGQATLWTYGEKDADLAFTMEGVDFGGSRFTLKTPRGARAFKITMPGVHNVYNAVAAIGAALAAGASLDTCAEALAKFAGVRGRLESVPNDKGVHVFVDYAHTDDALKSVLANLNRIRREAGLDNRLITVFGCGGDRDKGKRPLMMATAAALSDAVYLTSDNPRTEDPEAILADAIKGADPGLIGRKVFTEVDRRKAIGQALGAARPGDVVLIAGKGHETYQQIGTQKFDFDDVKVAGEILG